MCKHFFKRTFRTLCVVVTAGFTIWNCYRYFLDEDLATVQFNKFHSSKDRIYPAVTLCFGLEPVSQAGHYAEDNPQDTISEGHLSKRSILKSRF